MEAGFEPEFAAFARDLELQSGHFELMLPCSFVFFVFLLSELNFKSSGPFSGFGVD